MSLHEKILHQWLRLPYVLSIRYKRMKQPFKVTYVFIHGLADTGALWKPLIDKLPKNSNYIVVDLLGHGNSKYPDGDDMYRAAKQAQNVLTTCLRAGLSGPVVLVGHSFGALVATEFAHSYRGIVRRMVLVSPPIYRDETKGKKVQLQQDEILRGVYRQLLKQPNVIIKGYQLGGKLKLKGFSTIKIGEENYAGIAGTLRAGIISQRSEERLAKTTIPTTIIYGRFDPLLVPHNFTLLKRDNPNITVKVLATAHAVRDSTVKAILRAIAEPKK